MTILAIADEPVRRIKACNVCGRPVGPFVKVGTACTPCQRWAAAPHSEERLSRALGYFLFSEEAK